MATDPPGWETTVRLIASLGRTYSRGAWDGRLEWLTARVAPTPMRPRFAADGPLPRTTSFPT